MIEIDVVKALEIRNAIVLLSKVLDIEKQQIVARLCFYDQEKLEILKRAIKLWNEFEDASLIEKGKMFGYEIIES
jgi:hypothetical protein